MRASKKAATQSVLKRLAWFTLEYKKELRMHKKIGGFVDDELELKTKYRYAATQVIGLLVDAGGVPTKYHTEIRRALMRFNETFGQLFTDGLIEGVLRQNPN